MQWGRQRESSNLFLKRLQNSGSQSKQKVIYKVAVGGQIDGWNDRAKTTSIMHHVFYMSSVY